MKPHRLGFRRRVAPRLMVRYRCPHANEVLDAYEGAPFCLKCDDWLDPVGIVRATTHPDSATAAKVSLPRYMLPLIDKEP